MLSKAGEASADWLLSQTQNITTAAAASSSSSSSSSYSSSPRGRSTAGGGGGGGGKMSKSSSANSGMSKLLTSAKQSAKQSVRFGFNSVLKKCGVDAKIQFSLDPPGTESGFSQWLEAMRAVARLPDGIPHHFRRKLWITLAQHHIETEKMDWDEICKSAFSDRVTQDDDKLGEQIIKDLHRTGWSGLSGQGGEQERVLLKRVLLAYARYNKVIGYCQGFNVIAALVLDVTEYKEEQALKVMIFLVEHVLPANYFDQTLRALSVDMAVLRDLLTQRLPKLSAHLDYLQKSSESEYEPPLINVFSMQWFLTMFATCLPKNTVFRVWDSLMLEGSEVLLRSALAIWAKIGRRVQKTTSADDFYCIMGPICQELLQMSSSESNDLMQVVYSMAEFPYPGLLELRERHTWNIQPFSSTFRLLRQQVSSILHSDEEGSNTPDQSTTSACLPPITSDKLCSSVRGNGPQQQTNSSSNTANNNNNNNSNGNDLGQLQKQYKLLKHRQKQAAVILQTAYQEGQRQVGTAPLPFTANGFGRKGGNGNGNNGNRRASTTTPRNGNVPNNYNNNNNNNNNRVPEVFNHLYIGTGMPNGAYSTVGGAVPVTSKVVQPTRGSVNVQNNNHHNHGPPDQCTNKNNDNRKRNNTSSSSQHSRVSSVTLDIASLSTTSSTAETGTRTCTPSSSRCTMKDTRFDSDEGSLGSTRTTPTERRRDASLAFLTAQSSESIIMNHQRGVARRPRRRRSMSDFHLSMYKVARIPSKRMSNSCPNLGDERWSARQKSVANHVQKQDQRRSNEFKACDNIILGQHGVLRGFVHEKLNSHPPSALQQMSSSSGGGRRNESKNTRSTKPVGGFRPSLSKSISTGSTGSSNGQDSNSPGGCLQAQRPLQQQHQHHFQPGGGSSQQNNTSKSTLLTRSKAILNAIPIDPIQRPGPVFNPFPTRVRTRLIEREKRMGLYS